MALSLYTYIVFIDFKKAFDSVRRSAIRLALRRKGAPLKLLALLNQCMKMPRFKFDIMVK